MTVCVLTCGLVAALAVSAVAQETKLAEPPAGPDLGPIPTDKTSARSPGVPTGTPPGGDANISTGDANTSTGDGNTPGGGNVNKTSQGPDLWLFGVLLGGVVLMWLWMGRGRRKQESKRKEMLGKLKKGDKITTIGGVVGTVIEVKPDEVTVKVDETNNVRMKFARWSVRGIGEDAKTNPDHDKK